MSARGFLREGGARVARMARACSVALMLLVMASSSASSPKAPLTIEAAIETTRAMVDRDGRAVFISPNGNRYAMLLVRGDVERDGVVVELHVGALHSLEAARPKRVAKFFTRGLGRRFPAAGGSYRLTWPTTNVPFWIDDRRIGLYWEDAHGVRQLMSVDVEHQVTAPLTAHPTDVLSVAVGPSGSLLLSAAVPCETVSDANTVHGTAVSAKDAFELLYGCSLTERHNQRLYAINADGATRPIVFERGDDVARWPSSVETVFSADGALAIVSHTVASQDFPEAWRRYERAHLRHALAERAVDPRGAYARQLAKLFVVDVLRARARPLWDVPANVSGGMQVAWSPSGRSVLVGPTFLPLSAAESAGLAGHAIAEVEIATGAWRQVPLVTSEQMSIRELRWRGEQAIEIETEQGTRRFRRERGEWRRDTGVAGHRSMQRTARVGVELREGLNTPPMLYAVDRYTGEQQQLLDLNPNISSRVALGRVEWIQRAVADGETWEGRLYYPASYTVGERYPLVVQTHTFAGPEVFSLYGKGGAQPALGPGGSVYIAQSLAGEGFFVLHGARAERSDRGELLVETQKEIAAIEAVIEQLAAEGLVDRERVGIMGHSASGWLASYAITHSSFPYAAAITDDHKDGGYFQAALSGWDFGAGAEMIGVEPFGEGLDAWFEHSPAFNAHRVRTPLLMTVSSGGLELGAWEMFSRLRHLRRPVELFLVPDIEHGSHGLQNPRQIRALQQRALDWWRFWLKDEEVADPTKASQYAAWRRLRALSARE